MKIMIEEKQMLNRYTKIRKCFIRGKTMELRKDGGPTKKERKRSNSSFKHTIVTSEYAKS